MRDRVVDVAALAAWLGESRRAEAAAHHHGPCEHAAGLRSLREQRAGKKPVAQTQCDGGENKCASDNNKLYR